MSKRTPSKKTPRGWSDEHLDAITRFYTSHGAAHVASLVGRRVRAVQYMAVRLGLRPAGRPSRDSDWTNEQLAILRRTYPASGAQAVVELTGRKLKSVYCMASALHLRAPPRKKAAPTEKPAARPKQRAPARPYVAPARVLQGPARLPGPPVTTERTRYVVGPSVPRALRTNTHSML